MFDAKGRLVVCNERYLSMYGLSPAVVKPGANLIDIVRERTKTGSLDARSGGILRRASRQHGGRQDRALRDRGVRRPRHLGGQPRHPRLALLGRHPRRHYRTPRGGTKERAAQRSGSAPRRDRGSDRLVPRKPRRRVADRRRQCRRDEGDGDRAVRHLAGNHGAYRRRGRDLERGVRQRGDRRHRGGATGKFDRRDQSAAVAGHRSGAVRSPAKRNRPTRTSPAWRARRRKSTTW